MEIKPFKIRIKNEYQCIRVQKIILANGYTWIDNTTNVFLPHTFYDFSFDIPKREDEIDKKLSLVLFEDDYNELKLDEIDYIDFIKKYSHKLILFGR